jgi:hypothetical protein
MILDRPHRGRSNTDPALAGPGQGADSPLSGLGETQRKRCFKALSLESAPTRRIAPCARLRHS